MRQRGKVGKTKQMQGWSPGGLDFRGVCTDAEQSRVFGVAMMGWLRQRSDLSQSRAVDPKPAVQQKD